MRKKVDMNSSVNKTTFNLLDRYIASIADAAQQLLETADDQGGVTIPEKLSRELLKGILDPTANK